MLEGDLAASKAELKEWIQWSSLAKSDGILPATMLEQLHVEEAALVGGGPGLPRSRDSLDAAVSPLGILFCVCDVFSSRADLDGHSSCSKAFVMPSTALDMVWV